MILLFLLVSISAGIMSMALPKIIVRVEKNIISQCEETKKLRETLAPIRPCVAIALFNIGPVFYFFKPENLYLPVFLFLLSVSSYIDIVRHWLPDSLLFLLSGFSVYCIASGKISSSPEEQLIATFLFVFPFMLINGFSGLKKRVYVFASGDIYVALSIGLWLDKTVAMVVAGVSILSALLYGSVFHKNHLPFIPFIFFSFLFYCFS